MESTRFIFCLNGKAEVQRGRVTFPGSCNRSASETGIKSPDWSHPTGLLWAILSGGVCDDLFIVVAQTGFCFSQFVCFLTFTMLSCCSPFMSLRFKVRVLLCENVEAGSPTFRFATV